MNKLLVTSSIIALSLATGNVASAKQMSVAAQEFLNSQSDCSVKCVADGNGDPVGIAMATDLLWHDFPVGNNGKVLTFEMFYLNDQLPVNLQVFYKDSKCQDVEHPLLAVGSPTWNGSAFVQPITYDMPGRAWGDGYNLYGATGPSTVMTIGSWWSSWAANDPNTHGCSSGSITYAFVPATRLGSFKDWVKDFSIYHTPKFTVGGW